MYSFWPTEWTQTGFDLRRDPGQSSFKGIWYEAILYVSLPNQLMSNHDADD